MNSLPAFVFFSFIIFYYYCYYYYFCRLREIRGGVSSQKNAVLKFGDEVRPSVRVYMVQTRVSAAGFLLPVNLCQSELSQPPTLLIPSSSPPHSSGQNSIDVSKIILKGKRPSE